MARPADFGSGFLGRVRTATCVVGGLGVLVAATYLTGRTAWAIGAGLVLSLVNLKLLEELFHHLLLPVRDPAGQPGTDRNARPWLKVGLALAIKFPVLLGGTYVLLGPLHLPPLWFLAGFSLVLVVILLKILGGSIALRFPARQRWRWAGGRLVPPASPRPARRRSRGSASPRSALLLSALLLTALGTLIVFPFRGRATEPAPPAAAQVESGAAPISEDGLEPVGTEGGHGLGTEEAKEEEETPELPNAISILHRLLPRQSWVSFLYKWQNPFYSTLVVILLCVVSITVYRRRQLIPGRLQNLVELLVESFSNFILGILGPRGKEFVPFLGTLFFYIWLNNLQGLIPFFKSPTSVYNTTLALAICVFLYVQYTGLTKLGLWKYLHHMMGSPGDVMGWCMVPLMLPLHLIEEVAKPISLSLRLFGNILGEDILLGVFAGLGVAMLAFTKLPIGVPLHLPFIFLSILMSTIQALVFTLLATIYIFQMLPHEEQEEGHEH
jgi:F-type H+-transporting ATPase subunit a